MEKLADYGEITISDSVEDDFGSIPSHLEVPGTEYAFITFNDYDYDETLKKINEWSGATTYTDPSECEGILLYYTTEEPHNIVLFTYWYMGAVEDDDDIDEIKDEILAMNYLYWEDFGTTTKDEFAEILKNNIVAGYATEGVPEPLYIERSDFTESSAVCSSEFLYYYESGIYWGFFDAYDEYYTEYFSRLTSTSYEISQPVTVE